ncbi:MAG: hypothetical protein IPP29_15460 [Bacteroidetes bacterium]|nr:hypothetical protein [Bacteroidota bacterium]
MADNQEYNSGGDKRDDKNAFDKLKQNTPKFNFNIYWIYGIIIMAIIAVNFLSIATSQKKYRGSSFLQI